ncbi:MAG: APC family permease [Gammaproteobacteria bacterium]|nr:APC family permease [Gammaproteobacteria bacterium]
MALQSHQYKRVIGAWTMLFGAVSAIIGSGWLFSSYYSSQLAGPAALLSWIIASVLIIVLAFTFAEISTLLPIAGGSSHLPNITHGILTSVVFSWISWLTLTALPAIEVQAVLQYASYFFPWLSKDPNSINTSLSMMGYGVAATLLLMFSAANIYSIRLVMRFNSAIAIWKIVIPVFAAVTLITLSFHPSNFHKAAGFMPLGWQGVFTAIATGGILFAFNGFKNVIELAGEAKNPNRTIPFAIIGSIVVCLLIYILLQVALVGAIPAASLTHGWALMNFPKSVSPLVTLLAMAGSVFILGVLYIDTLIAPMGAGLMYITAGARTLQAMGKNNQMPSFLKLVNKKHSPVYAILINMLLSFVFFFPFPGWKVMVDFISSLMAFSYVLGPVCLLALRYQLPDQSRKIRLPFSKLWSFLALYICTMMGYWTGWEVMMKLTIFIAFSIAFYLVLRCFSKSARETPLDFKSSIWIFVYFGGLAIASHFGGFGGGTGQLKFGPDFGVLGLLTAVSLFLATKYRVSDKEAQARCAALLSETES